MTNSVTTYKLKDIESESYRRDEVTPNQIARMNTALFGTPDIDVEEHISYPDGTNKVFINKANPDGTTSCRAKHV